MDTMKRAVYSVEIKVERDKTTGQTRVLSSHTKLPVDCSRGGVKVYEDEQKVVHEVNGQDGVHLLSAAEVDELILKADQVEADPEDADPEDADPEEADPEEADPEEADPEDADPEEADPEEADPEEAGESRSGREITMASGDVTAAAFGGQQDSPQERNVPWEPVTDTVLSHQGAQARGRADNEVAGPQGSVEEERVLIRDGKSSPPGGGAEPEAATPPPAPAPMPRMDKRESTGVTAAKGKKARTCCSVM